MEDSFIWRWCWFCDAATINSPNNKENTCCAFWHDDMEWSLAAKEFMKNNPVPEHPNQQDIDDWVKLVSAPWTEEERLVCEIFGKHALEESEYYYVRCWADKENLNLPTLEELSTQSGHDPHYDCKTGAEWGFESEIKVINPTGWNPGDFETERIPWRIYCRRRRDSECDYSEYIADLKARKNIDYTIAGEAKKGDTIRIMSGSCEGKEGVVVSGPYSAMMTVRLTEEEHNNLICVTNCVEILQ